MIKRNLNTEKEIEKRFNSFDEDIKHWNDYDYILINKNLETCFKQIENIISQEKRFYFESKFCNFIINFRANFRGSII